MTARADNGDKAQMRSFKLPRTSLLLGTLAALFVPAAVFADITIPHLFSAGTPAVATQVNDNFTALNTGKQDKLATVSFQHVVSAANTSGAFSVITNPLTDGKPKAVLLFSPNLGTGVVSYTYGKQYALQYYSGHWGISTMDGSTFPLPATNAGPLSFDILVLQ
jgi:hypothetical protein